MSKLDAFTRQYIETALWSSTDNADDSGGEPLDKNYSSDDIDPATIEQMIADCASFQEKFAELLSESGIEDGRAGHDFWLSRNGHGSGYFDEDTIDEEFQEKLQDAAESYGNVDLQVDDGVISDGIHWTPVGVSEAPMAHAYRRPPYEPGRGVGRTHAPGGGTMRKVKWEPYRGHTLDIWTLGRNSFKVEIYNENDRSQPIREAFGRTPEEAFAAARAIVDADPGVVSERHHVVADFTTLPEIIAHAQAEGATHVVVSRSGATVYFPIRSGGRYEEAILWHEHGYWHSPAPTHTKIVERLPKGAEPIGEYLAGGQVAAERHGHAVRDYVAVDNRGRQLAGPFKDYGTAKQHADRAGGYVEFAMKEGHGVAAARRPRKDPTAWRSTPEGHAKYVAARAEAQREADKFGYDYGIEANDLFKSFHVFMLPSAQHRSGHELRCEVVHPTNPDTTKPGHGPGATRDTMRGLYEQRGHGVAARRPTDRLAPGSMMTAGGVLMLAGELSKKVGGTTPKYIEGGFRWSEPNESAQFTTYSPEHGQKVVVVVSIFSGSTALGFFSNEGLSETDRYENISSFTYGEKSLNEVVTVKEMVKDVEWVWETVDGYAESWGAGQDEVDEARPRGRGMRAAPSADEVAEMIEIMERHGYSAEDARKLSAEGMGPMELEHILRTTKPGGMGSLEYTHRIHKVASGVHSPAPHVAPPASPKPRRPPATRHRATPKARRRGR